MYLNIRKLTNHLPLLLLKTELSNTRYIAKYNGKYILTYNTMEIKKFMYKSR